jgi:hypothetical protein
MNNFFPRVHLKMPYDEALFERTFLGVALSQRLKHNWHKFKGTLSLAFNLLSFNYFIGVSARPVAFILLLYCLTVLSILSFLIVKRLANPRNTLSSSSSINEEDLGMDNAVRYVWMNNKNCCFTVLFLILMWGFLLAVLMSPTKERYGTGV